MSSGFGVVRAVNSGDSVSIFETVRGPTGGYPPIRDIYLSNIQAPKLGYNNGTDKVRSSFFHFPFSFYSL